MKIQVNTDKNIEGKESLNTYVQNTIAEALERFSEHITRIDVHLSDDNGGKQGAADKRCLIEVKAEGIASIAATEVEDNLHKAINGAIDKIKKSLTSKFGKLNTH